MYDISERKLMEDTLRESRKRYQMLSEGISDGIFVANNGRLEFVNDAFSELVGRIESEIIGKSFCELLDEDQCEKLEKFLSIQSSNDERFNVEIKINHHALGEIYVEIVAHYIASEGVVYGIIHDVTKKRKQQEKNIIKTIIATEEREREIFSKELHDGLGPLLSMNRLYMDSLKRAKTDEVRNEILEKSTEILKEAIVAVSEISNRLSPHVITNYGFDAAVWNYIHKVGQSDYAPEISFTSNYSRPMKIDLEIALYRVVVECINNSLKYANAKHITLQLDQTEKRIKLQYADDGNGFDIDGVLGKQNGLGLLNIQNRIRSVNGTASMKSKIGEGVQFDFVIPITPPEA